MSIKGVKLKSESFFSISPGVLELWRKNLRGGIGLMYEKCVKAISFHYLVIKYDFEAIYRHTFLLFNMRNQKPC